MISVAVQNALDHEVVILWPCYISSNHAYRMLSAHQHLLLVNCTISHPEGSRPLYLNYPSSLAYLVIGVFFIIHHRLFA